MEIWLQGIVDKVVDMLLKRFDERFGELVASQQKRYLIQKEVKEEYNCNARDIAAWEAAGLKRFRRGKTWVYDRKDIEALFETLKR